KEVWIFAKNSMCLFLINAGSACSSKGCLGVMKILYISVQTILLIQQQRLFLFIPKILLLLFMIRIIGIVINGTRKNMDKIMIFLNPFLSNFTNFIPKSLGLI